MNAIVLSNDETTILYRMIEAISDELDTDDETYEVVDRLVEKIGTAETTDASRLIEESEIDMIAGEEGMGYQMCNRCLMPVASVAKEGEEQYYAGLRCGCEEPPEHGWTTPYAEQIPGWDAYGGFDEDNDVTDDTGSESDQ